MEATPEDREWGTKYRIDPVHLIDANQNQSQRAGPSHHHSQITPESSPTGPISPQLKASSHPPVSRSSFTRKPLPSNSPTAKPPTPPSSASPTRTSFSSRNPYLRSAPDSPPPRSKGKAPSQPADHRRQRSTSLTERFPGDMSHRPLDQLRKEAKTANRSPHLRKQHIPGADIVDSLDKSMLGPSYHHEGPYDATLISRNTNMKNSPVAATQETNEMALKATPKEYIRDALDKHVPLRGVAIIPPGELGFDGKPMEYEEGADLMREPDAAGGPYKRWDHITYLPEDYKGKGEPSFSIERALKQHKQDPKSHRRAVSESYEMQPQGRSMRTRERRSSGADLDNASDKQLPAGTPNNYSAIEGTPRRRNTTGKGFGAGLKSKFGSLRKSKKVALD